MSPRSPALSDGEIVSGDEEKAIRTRTHTKANGAVNSSTRLPSGASSRAPQLDGPADTRSDRSRSPSSSLSPLNLYPPRERKPSPFRNGRPRSRSPFRHPRPRSRSPYRAPKPNPGDKRGREDDHYSARTSSDPRRFKVHYEGETSRRNAPPAQNRQSAFDRSEAHQAHHYRDDRTGRGRTNQGKNDRREYGRSKRAGGERSRSPFRHDRSERSGDHFGRRGSLAESVTSSKDGEFGRSARGIGEDRGRRADGTRISDDSGYGDGDGQDKQQQEAPEVEDVKQLTEAEQIEQGRKRRAALKAKFKTQQPLLVQALEQNITSAPATPVHESSGDASAHMSPSSAKGSPQTPLRTSAPGSPAEFTVTNDEELVDRRHADSPSQDDGPSAADYDPNMDMQEDRKRVGLQNTAVNVAAPTVEAAVPKQAPVDDDKDFDMFADDDDDMFAPGNTAAKSITATTKEGRTLDESLLDNWDYPDGHYRIILGELLLGRYAIQQQIGKGTFATVVRAQDIQTGTSVAIKIAANNETMHKAGDKEKDMVELLNKDDSDDKKHIIRLLGSFVHKNHMCLVFENLSADLREVLKKFGRNIGLNLKAIRSYGQQMFIALSHLKRCDVLHADLKPDNILVSDKRNVLKVCDLGTAAMAWDAEITPYLVSRFYRAPEVILGIPIDHAIDMWSIGCTLFELYTGRILFAGSDNNQMLRVIQECRGHIPIRMLKRSTLADKHFDPTGIFISQERDKFSGNLTMRPLNFNKTSPEKDLKSRLMANAKGIAPAELKEVQSFIDLMEKCLQLDPAKRITPNDALRHPFIAHATTAPAEKARTIVPAMMPVTRVKP